MNFLNIGGNTVFEKIPVKEITSQQKKSEFRLLTIMISTYRIIAVNKEE